MARRRSGVRCGLIFVALAPFANVGITAERSGDLNKLRHGQALFERQWKAGDSHAPKGDGLGPMHNDVSCKACHSQGAIGGGGPLDKNVELLSLMSAPPPPLVPGMIVKTPPHALNLDPRPELAVAVSKVHPAFLDGLSLRTHIVLHRHSTSADYLKYRSKLLQLEHDPELVAVGQKGLPRPLGLNPVEVMRLDNGLAFRVSQRNSTALFGAGQIDAIPALAIRHLAREQSRINPAISGRIGPVEGKDVGRFGWRAQTANLRSFVLGACANELGLQVPTQDQPLDPTQPGYKPRDNDLSKADCDALISFVSALPAPRQIVPEDPQQAKIVAAGEAAFHRIGCAVCHVRDVSPAFGIYSDLLLHDMGNALADPAPATPEMTFVPSGGGGGSYGGSASAQGQFVSTPRDVTEREWRTPPLWGVRDSAPYLHDGRADTLVEAIALHGGEAKSITANYFALPVAEQLAVIRFLNSLAATQPSAWQE